MIRFQNNLTRGKNYPKGLIFWSLCFFVFVCSFPALAQESSSELQAEIPLIASAEEEILLDQGRSLLEQGDPDQALASFERFLLQYPESVLLPDVYLQFSSTYAQKGELKKKIEALNTFLHKFPEDARLSEVRLQLSQAHITLGDLGEVMAFWADIPEETDTKIEIYLKVAQAYSEQQDYLNALSTLMRIKELMPGQETDDAVRSEAISIIREKLAEPQLQSVIKQYGGSFPADQAMIRLAEIYANQADHFRRQRELKRFLSLFPDHAFSASAEDLINRIEEKVKSNRFLIGVAFHFSGSFSGFRENALNGALLALEEFKERFPGASVGLTVKDLGENSSGLEASLEAWLEEYRPIAMVGPLLSKVVERVTPIVERAGIPLITPGATVSRLNGLGHGIFRNAMTTRFQCRAIAEYGVVTRGLKRFAVLFPDEAYWTRWAECFSEEVTRLGGEIVHAEPYPLDVTDFSPAIRRLKEADLELDGVAEIRQQKRKKREISYSPGFQALFLPGDADKVGLLIPQLVFHNINDTAFLGTSGWNTPEFEKLAGRYAEGATFIDGFFPESPEPAVQDFVSRYRNRFQREPDLFAAQAHDARCDPPDLNCAGRRCSDTTGDNSVYFQSEEFSWRFRSHLRSAGWRGYKKTFSCSGA